ncbi:hypothetical protein BO71DRAFT_463829 [Aspergillus ellipticus CBS 707.79]|uniref:Alpha-1,3-glucanase/mutanase n=1 Tax=Aspergillus ellipticus CBS 707.79 TaxID=1448320 RepID=A0A319CXH8_9EURO|nr:hypothetical protein BO71DRAFT_463829 [Aspergillus ellipticus CBS 707.79]
MVSNTAGYTVADWENEIQLAIDAHIDAFALNMAAGEDTTSTSVPNAFTAAQNLKFSLFFSFDYAGNGAWDKDDVVDLLAQHVSNNVYFFHGANPLVSTFEGPDNAEDWVWAAWPNGPNDMNTYVDASYIQYLDKRPYMMPVSPWFFTNMPGYDKNWLWRGDDLWYERWEQAIYLDPEFIEIISWNDFGESHYIGPIVDSHNELADSMYTAFGTGDAPYNYVEAFDHSGWRQFLPYVIDLYKQNLTDVGQEGLVAWYRLNEAGACADGGTTGNTVSQLQLEYWPKEIVQDKVFFSALGGVGIYHGSVSFSGYSGDVVVSVTASGGTITVEGQDISSGCSEGDQVENWNSWVGYTMGESVGDYSPDISNWVCIEGWGMGDFNGLCSYACSLGYCPVGACVCTKLGPQPTLPTPSGIQGYPAAGKDANYAGLCAFDCTYGDCLSTVCGTEPATLTIPTVSPFTPDTCVSGSGVDDLAGLCSYACNYGYCPIYNCTCTATGPLNDPPAQNSSITSGWAPDVDDNGLCNFACTRNYCPGPVCLDMTPGDDDSGCEDDDDCDIYMPCDFSINYSSLDALQANTSNIDPYCVGFYVLGALYGELEATLANYTSIASATNYDEDFSDYASYMKSQVMPQLRFFMNDSYTGAEGVGNQYFKCTLNIGGVNKTTGSCPADNGEVSVKHTVFYDLVDADGFYSSLTTNVGVEQDWVVLTGGYSNTLGAYYTSKGNTECNAAFNRGTTQCYWWRGFPIPAQDITVTDPRNLMKKALPNIPDLQLSILLTQLDIMSGSFNGVIDDAVQTFSTAVFMLAELVDRIYNVVSIGAKIEADKKKERILSIIGGVFMILPFLGPLSELGDVIDGLDAALALVGTLGYDATEVYSIAQDPTSAPVIILNMLLGFDGGSEASEDGLNALEFDSLASDRRGMADADIKGVGDVLSSKTDQLESIVSQCLRY